MEIILCKLLGKRQFWAVDVIAKLTFVVVRPLKFISLALSFSLPKPANCFQKYFPRGSVHCSIVVIGEISGKHLNVSNEDGNKLAVDI